MTEQRIAIAQSQGVFTPPVSGRALWVNATPDSDRAIFEGFDLSIVQGLQPLNDQLAGQGAKVLPEMPTQTDLFDLVVIDIPRARALAKQWIAQAAQVLTPEGVLVVEGAKTDGIDSLHKAYRGSLTLGGTFTKAHGRAFWGHPSEGFPLPLGDDSQITPQGFVTRMGVFSADHEDAGSLALIAALPEKLKGRIGDLGAGWGLLSAHVLKLPKVTSVDLVEADYRALAAARRNIDDARARFHWADATAWQPDGLLDAVVMNPPFHTGRKGTPELGQTFVQRAAACLTPSGQLWMVANRHLPYETTLNAEFRTVKEVAGTSSFKVLCATHPTRKQRRG